MPGYVASRLGLPIDRLVIATTTNVNDILARTIATGSYDLREVVATSSPSMDIQVASNFERLLFEVYDRDGDAVRRLMASLAQSGSFAPRRARARGDTHGISADRGRGGNRGDHTHHSAGDRTGHRSAHRGGCCGR